MKYRLVSLIMSLVLGAFAANAQAVLEVEAPNVVALGEPFNVVYTTDRNVDDFISPEFSSFDVLAGPLSSTSRSVRIINGKRESSYNVRYTFTLAATEEGTFIIPPASVIAGKKEYKSSPVSIEVVKDNQPSAAVGSEASESDVFLKLTLDKTRAVKGEPVTATLELYTRSVISGLNDIKFPTFNGFWSQEIEAPQSINFERRNYNGRIYDVALLRKYMLLPQQEGDIEIDPAAAIIEIQVREQSSGNSFFDDFFDNYRTIRKRIVTDRKTVHVSALPDNPPASFAGGVGKFSLSVNYDSDTLRLHEESSVIISVSGRGNVNLIDSPAIKFPSEFEVYDVKTEDRTSSNSGGTQGSKLFEYPFIPRVPGDYEIPPVEFSYYDIGERKYKTLHSEPIRFHVEGPAAGSAGSPVSANAVSSAATGKQAVKVLGEDIRYIHVGQSGLGKGMDFLIFSPLYWIIVAIAVAAAAVLHFVLSKVVKNMNDIDRKRSRKARKVARTRLAKAKGYIDQKLYSPFYEELSMALTGYAADKLHIPYSEMSKDGIRSRLADKGVPEETAGRFIALLDACDYARYAPEPSYEDMGKHYEEAVDMILYLEEKL